jgi:hypothetical protein
MTLRLPPILTRREFPDSELHALRLDGEVYAVGEGAAPIDEIDSPELRATSLGSMIPRGLIVEQRSAAWVWGAQSHPPERHEVCVDVSARRRPPFGSRIRVREVVLCDDDSWVVAEIRVTTPLRTAIDLARFVPSWGANENFVLGELMRIGAFDAADCARSMNRRANLPNKTVALERLALVDRRESARADAVHVVDRVDAPHRVQNAIEMRRVAHLEDEATERKAIA